MKKFDSLIFDLDGTLWDASSATAAGWNKVTSKLNIPLQFQASDIRSVSGLPFDECISVLFKNISINSELIKLLDQAEKNEIVYSGGVLFANVKNCLEILLEKYNLFLISNCQDWYLQAFFNHSGLKNIFTDSTCLGQTGLGKSKNIQNMILKHQLKKPVYIGDTQWDQEASAIANIDFIFARYGFGQVDTMSCTVIDSFDDLIKLLQ